MDSIINQYLSARYILMPINGKTPIIKGWQKLTESCIPKGYKGNIGVVLQHDDLVMDIDTKKKSFDPVKTKKFIDTFLCNTTPYIVETGTGGYHFYFKKPADFSVHTLIDKLPAVEFWTRNTDRGRQMVIPGSIHPDTGKKYVIRALSPLLVPRLDKDHPLLQEISKNGLSSAPDTDFISADPGQYTDTSAGRTHFLNYLENEAPKAIEGENGDTTTFMVACRGRDFSLPPEAVFELMWREWNEKCIPPWTYDELKVKVGNAYRYAENSIGNSDPAKIFNELPKGTTKAPKGFIKDKAGEKILTTKIRNVVLPFTEWEKSELYRLVRYNAFSRQIEFTRRAPWHDEHYHPSVLTDRDISLCREYFERRYGFTPSITMVYEGLVFASHTLKIHPVRNYLNKLVWDGTPRIDQWLIDYCHADNNEYVKAVGAKTLIAAVARIYNPGCKHDHVLILEGRQGIGKSTVVSILGGKWYGDFYLDTHNKDTIQYMLGNWIVELSEMECTRRAETQALKAFISRPTDRVRLPYARVAEDYARQCIFIGTINPESGVGYLQDKTGNRRYWCVSVRTMKLDELLLIRDQLWAEAVARFKRGEKWYLDSEKLCREAAKESLKRTQTDPWEDNIIEYIANRGSPIDIVGIRELWEHCLHGVPHQFGRTDRARICHIMENVLQWEKGVYHHPKMEKTVRGYRRTENSGKMYTSLTVSKETINLYD